MQVDLIKINKINWNAHPAVSLGSIIRF